jgi:hypothetical protein
MPLFSISFYSITLHANKERIQNQHFQTLAKRDLNQYGMTSSVELDITLALIVSDKGLVPETYMPLCSNIWRRLHKTQSQNVLKNHAI